MGVIFLEILKCTLPAAIVAITVYLMMRSHSQKEQQLKLLELKSKVSKETMPLQLQAYERLALLVHRLAPENLVPRTALPQGNVIDLKKVLVQSVKQEFEHNITQQIYVSPRVWNAVSKYHLDLIAVINDEAGKLAPAAPSIDLSTAILEYFMQAPTITSSAEVMDLIKHDIKSFLQS